MNRPRVLYLAPVSYMKGGAEVVLMTMLANPLVDPVLAVPEPGQLSEAAGKLGIPVCFFHPRAMLEVHRPLRLGVVLRAGVDLLVCSLRVRRLARAHGCAVIHSNGMKPHIISAILGAMFGMSTLAHVHDIPHSRVEGLIWRMVGAAVQRVVLVSRVCWPGGRLPGKVRVMPNGFIPQMRSYQQRALGPVLRLGFVGRFTQYKGLDLLLDWISAARAGGVPFILHLRGRADPESEAYWRDIQARIAREELGALIQLDGWRDKTMVYEGLDILLVPSRIPDPLPLAATEAMGAGLIVATYPAGGLTDYITHGETGFLIPTPEILATILRRLRDEPALYDHVRRQGYDKAVACFELGHFYQGMADLYAEMLSIKAAGKAAGKAAA